MSTGAHELPGGLVMNNLAENRPVCGQKHKCPKNYGQAKLAFPMKTPMMVRRDIPKTVGSICHLTPIFDGVEGQGFDCNGKGQNNERTMSQLHFDIDHEDASPSATIMAASASELHFDIAHAKSPEIMVHVPTNYVPTNHGYSNDLTAQGSSHHA